MFMKLNSIYWRILNAFVFIILLTILLSTTIEYISTKAELPRLLTEIRTKNIAQTLSATYTRDKSLVMVKQEILRMDLSFRIILKDNDGKTFYNSFTDMLRIEDSPLIEGDTVKIFDFDTGEAVGSITMYINRAFLEGETGEYIFNILKPRILQGLITMVTAFFAAAFLSIRITTPIIALTKATGEIAQKKDSSLLQVQTSDELGQMSKSFNQMISSLSIQRDLRKRLISDVSHEINTPLNVIRLEAKGLLDEITTAEEAANRIIDEIDTLNKLINDLDWLAETDSGEFKLKLEKHSLGEIIENEVGRWQLKAQIEEISLKLQPLPVDLPDIQLDCVRISQVLGNLIENSFKYVQSDGTVTIACRYIESEVIISVEDTGPGIEELDLPYIFERFYRTDQLSRKKKGGRGLGLSIVKQIVEMHFGRVWVESEEGKGCCFYFSLPVS